MSTAEQLLLGGHGLTSRTTSSVEAELRQRIRSHRGRVSTTERWARDVAEWACPGPEPSRRCPRPTHCTLLGCAEDDQHRGEPWACRVRRGEP